jgi:endonuclease YncB( thermonuclease family)
MIAFSRSIVIPVILAFSTVPILANEFYSGPVLKVTDGDTFTISNDGQKVRVRFCGVDSPERRQPGYSEASEELGRLTMGKDARCIQVGGGTPCDGRSPPISRDRIVAQCFVDDRDIAMEMICSGNAKDWPKFSGGYYSACRR